MSACASNISFRKINSPSEQEFKNSIKEMRANITYDSFPDIKKQMIDSEIFYHENKNKTKKRVLDSLKPNNKNNFFIVDANRDFNGRRVVSSYFFFKDKIIIAGFRQIDYYKNNEWYSKFLPYANEVNVTELKKDGDNVLTVKNYFDKDRFEKITGPINFNAYVNFNVTVVLNNKVGYYAITTDTLSNKVKKIK